MYKPQGEITYLPVAYDGPPPGDEELAEATAIVCESGWLREIAGDQQWAVLDHEWRNQWISLPNADRPGIRFTAVWEQPVESDGPWYIGKCRWTRIRKGYTTFRNIRTVQVVVDMDRRIPLTRSAAAPFHTMIESASPSQYREQPRPPYEPAEESKNPIPVGIPPVKETKVIMDAITGEVLYRGHYENVPRRLRKCPPGMGND